MRSQLRIVNIHKELRKLIPIVISATYVRSIIMKNEQIVRIVPLGVGKIFIISSHNCIDII